MPIEYHIDPQRRIAVVEGRGTIRDEDLLDFVERVRADRAYFSGIHELVDLREADISGLTTGTIRRVAAFFRTAKGSGDVRVAIVASKDADYGISRMYQALRGDEPTPLEIFRSVEEARAWLGVAE